MLCTIFICMLFVLGVKHRTYRLLPRERLTSKRLYRNSLMKLLWVTILVESENLQESLDHSWGAALARSMCLRLAHRPNQQWSWAALAFFLPNPRQVTSLYRSLVLVRDIWYLISDLLPVALHIHSVPADFILHAMANNWHWQLVKVLNLMESKQAVLGELLTSVICVVVLPAISKIPIYF